MKPSATRAAECEPTGSPTIGRTVESAKSSLPVSYDDFRTGLTYYDVYHMIFGRRWKRRHGVLGKWRQIKQAMYAQYAAQFAGED